MQTSLKKLLQELETRQKQVLLRIANLSLRGGPRRLELCLRLLKDLQKELKRMGKRLQVSGGSCRSLR